MGTPVLYGPSFSTYTRTARLAFEEKGVEYRLEPINIMSGEAKSEQYAHRQPFGKVPSLEHDGFSVYETSAIVRYIDQAFPGKSLQPSDPKAAARMNQIIGIIDSYGYGVIVGKLVWQRLIVPMQGGEGDDEIVEGAKRAITLVLSEIERIKGSDLFLVGSDLTLADCFLAPIFAYFAMTPDHSSLLNATPNLARWWELMNQRPSMQKTPPEFG